MKVRRVKKSTTFKTHFFSALCRSLFTNASLIFVNSIFVKSVGGKSYSQLFFFASMASVIYYVHFALRGDKEAYTVYKVVLCITLIASIFCFLEPFSKSLQPYNIPLLYCLAVSVIVVDLIGTTLGPVVLQLSVNPAIFREVYQKIVTAELIARVAAAALIWFLSMNHWLDRWYPVGWAMLITHFILFDVTLRRLRRVERKERFKKDDTSIGTRVQTALKFIFSNTMVRLAMTIMIWSQVAKFLIEYLFYQAADARFPSGRQIASFVSVVTMTMIVLSIFVQHMLGKRLTQRLQLSTLFSFQPVNILLLGCLALVLPPFWPVVLLLVTYNVINRSIQLPVSRQCLVPVPRHQRSTIVSLICIFMSSATMVASGIMAVLKNALHFQDFLVLLLGLGVAIFFVITGLDSYYIRNLWSFYRESRSGHWQDEPIEENLSSVQLESTGSLEDPQSFKPTADVNSHTILQTYATSVDHTELSCATAQHRQLISSKDDTLVLLGLRICFIAGFPWFDPVYRRSLTSKSDEVREFARLALQVNDEYRGLQGYSSVFIRRIKGLTLEFLENPSEREYIHRLKILLILPDHDAAESLVAALSDGQFKDFRDTLLDCISGDGLHLTLKPIVERMYESDYENGQLCRKLLDRLDFGRNSPELLNTIQANLSSLKKDKLALWSQSPESDRDPVELQRFMHTLFAEEYRLCPQELDRALTDTIQEFSSIPPEDSAMLIDMHLEFLKRSELFKTWRALMA